MRLDEREAHRERVRAFARVVVRFPGTRLDILPFADVTRFRANWKSERASVASRHRGVLGGGARRDARGRGTGRHGMFEQSHAHFNIRDLVPGWMPPRSSPRPSLSAPHRPIHLLAPFRATRRGSTTALGRFCARPLSFFSVFLGEGGCAGMAGDVVRDRGSGSRPSDARQSIIASPVRASSSPNTTPSSAANARNDALLPRPERPRPGCPRPRPGCPRPRPRPRLPRTRARARPTPRSPPPRARVTPRAFPSDARPAPSYP